MNTRKKTAAGRIGALLATLGMLVLSSGIALMVTASPASAENCDNSNEGCYWQSLPDEICEKDNSAAEGGAYTMPAPPEDRVWSKLIIKKGSGNIGVENQVFNNPVAAGTYTWQGFDPKQSGGWSHAILCSVPEQEEEEPQVTNASVTPVQPSCANGNVASYTTSGEHVTFGESAAPAPGTSIVVTATTVAGWEFDGGATEKAFPLDFAAAETPCTFVDPPKGEDPPTVVVDPPTVAVDPPSSTVVTPTVVNAGLGDLAGDVRAEQGLALVLAGMIMVMAAGGLGLVRVSGRI